ncbi:hypothetical protein UlMin_027008 [Ulmus minor]
MGWSRCRRERLIDSRTRPCRMTNWRSGQWHGSVYWSLKPIKTRELINVWVLVHLASQRSFICVWRNSKNSEHLKGNFFILSLVQVGLSFMLYILRTLKACKGVQKLIDWRLITVNIQMKLRLLVCSTYFISLSFSLLNFLNVQSVKEKCFLYDIVANGRTGIDVDKFDYIVCDSCACGLGCSFQFERLMEIMRVMGDQICYRAKDYLTIHKLFATRADLYRTVYTHAKVKAIELMVVDALLKANDSLKIVSKTQQPDEFWKLDDTILKTIETSTEKELSEARNLILRIRRRDLYQFYNEFSVPKERLDYLKNITPQDIIYSQRNDILMMNFFNQKSGGVTLREEDIAVSNAKIDLTRGRNNPLQRYLRMISSSVP